jgi:hypothetical protein
MPPPPRASLQRIPPELRNEIFHLVDISTLMRVVSAAKLVTAYQGSQPEEQTAYGDSSGWRKFMTCGPNNISAQSPILDLSALLDLSTALHPLNRVSRQLHAGYHPTQVQTKVSRYRFMVHNFNTTQMELVSVAINTLGINEWHIGILRLPHERERYEVCLVTDDDVVSSARALCETIQQNNGYPSGLTYFKIIGWLMQVTTTMKLEQKQEICDMVEAMLGQTSDEEHSRFLGILQRWFIALKCEALTRLP